MKAAKIPPPREPAARQPSRSSRDAILEAAEALLREEGGAAFTIGAVVQRTGVARTTLYRYWPSREDLLKEILGRLDHPANMPEDSRTRVLKAASQLIVERGPVGFSIDAIVTKTGIAKTTIYRYWESRNALLLAAIEDLGGAARIPDTGSLRQDLVEFFMVPLREWMSQGQANFPSIPALIEAAKRDPEFFDVGRRLQDVTLQSLRPMIERGRARGEVRRDRSIDVMTHMLYGSLFVYSGMGHALTEAFVIEMVDTFLEGVSPKTGEPSKPRHRKRAR